MSVLRNKNKISLTGRVIFPALFLVLAGVVAYAFTTAWVNNQNATSVLGQTNFTTASAAAGATKFFQPSGARFDATSGKLFVTDCANNRILRFTNAQAIANGGSAEAAFGQTDLNGATSGSGQSKVNCPGEVAIDSAGHLWVADTTNSRVLRWDNAATATSGQPASGVLGQPDFATNTAGTTQSKMAFPEGLFIDGGGRLWVADSFNNRVLRFDGAATKPDGSNADAVLGQIDFVSNSAAMTATKMAAPNALTGNSTGSLWVSDSGNNRVLRFDTAASKANGGNADGVLGTTSFTSVPANRTTQSTFDTPGGVAIDPQNRFYVADTANNRVLVFNNILGAPNGPNASNVLGQPNYGDATPRLSQSGLDTPYTPTFDNLTESLWVADLGNNRVMRFNPLVVTAGSVSVSGRVTDRAGSGLRNARVTFTDQSGAICTAVTNSFGFYTLGDLPSGSTYVANVTARGYTFDSQVIQVMDNLTDVNFAAQ